MATLANQLKQNKKLVRGPGGQLAEETPEEIQSLAGQAGLQAPPITPLGAAALGANPDQQKMMGTAQQKEAALQIAQAPVEQSLSGALRRQQVRSEATAQEQQAFQKSENLQNLGGLGDRVNDFINTQRQILQEQAGKGVRVETAEAFKGQDIANAGDLKNMLQEFRTNPNNQDLLLKINTALGYDVNTQLSPEQVDQLYESTVQSISRGAAGNVDDDLNVNDLVNIQGFGYDIPTLSTLLGVPEADIGKMSVGQLRGAVDKVASDEFSKTGQLEQQAQSGQLGQAERGLARQAAMEASRTGQRSSEADIASLEDQISSADVVSFAGREMNVDELLKDETISAVIADYMNSAPGSEIRNAVDQGEPGLRDFIQKNAAVLADASQQMQGGAKTFQDTQAYNKRLQYEPFGGTKLDDSLASMLIPGFGKLQASRVDINQVPILRMASERGPEYGRQMASNINGEYKNDPTTAEDLKGLDFEMVKAWDMGSADPNSNWNTKYIAPKRFWEEVQRTPPEQRDALLNKAFKNINNVDDAQGRLSGNRSSNVLGFGSSLNAGVIDANGDGVVDSGEEIRNALLKANPRPTLRIGPASQSVYARGDLESPKIPTEGIDAEIFKKLNKDALKGSINYGDLVNNKISLDEAIRLQDMGGKGNVGTDDVNRRHGELRNENTTGTINQIMGEGDRNSQVSKLQQLLDSGDDRRINKDLLRNKLSELGVLSAEERGRQEAADREATRKRVKQQNEIKTLVTGGIWAGLPPETQEALNKFGTDLGEGQLKELKKTWDWDNNRSAGENLGVLARNVTTLPGRQAINAGQALQKNVMDGTLSKGVTEGVKSYGNQIADTAKNPAKVITGGGGGCFVAGTKFYLDDGSLKEVDKLTPHDKLLLGGSTIATAQFVCNEMYNYLGVSVAGSHAVIEDGAWVRVRASKKAIRDEELDGCIVYVVWNTKHRMIHETGIEFSDYAETDSTVAEIEEMRNIDELNAGTALS